MKTLKLTAAMACANPADIAWATSAAISWTRALGHHSEPIVPTAKDRQ
jgi:hypothetical protein